MTAPSPIKLVVGDDWIFPFTYKDAAGAPIDLTGFQVGGDVMFPGGKLSMAPPGGSSVLLDQSVTGNRGKFILTLDKSESVKCPPKKIGTHLRAYLIDPAGEKRSFPAWPLDVDER